MEDLQVNSRANQRIKWLGQYAGVMVAMLLVTCVFSGCVSPGQDRGTLPPHPVTVTDSKGTVHTLPAPVTRIVTQNGDAAELLIAIGAGDTIVGVADHIKRDPELSARIPLAANIGDWLTPDIEAVIACAPDVMITYGSRTRNIDKLLAANITVIALDCYRPYELAREARVLGTITGKENAAEEYARFVEKNLELVDRRLAELSSQSPPVVYIEHYTDYSAEGKEGGGAMLLARLHATYIGADLPGLTQRVSPEWIIDRRPGIIIKIAGAGALEKENLSSIRQGIMERNGFDSIPAVRTGRVYVINGELLNSPRGMAGVVYIAKALYPEHFRDIDPGVILEEYAERFYPGADQIERIAPELT